MRVARLLPEGKALVRQDKLETVVDTSLVENVRVGDQLIIHAGYAIEILDAAEAEERLALFDEMAAKAPRQDSP
jgi:hydrogenase expression/formation protein HypC